MGASEFVSNPGELLILSVGVGAAGVLFLWIANVWEKAMGENEASRLERTRHYRNMRALDQLNAFYSDRRNMPVSVGMGSIVMVFAGICGVVAALVWFVIRLI
jgi:hypothetical protein